MIRAQVSILFILYLLLLTTLSCSLKEDRFNVTTFNLSDSIESRAYESWKVKNKLENISFDPYKLGSPIQWDSISQIACLLENEHYRIFGTNSGEWEGAIIFEDKSSEFSYIMNCHGVIAVKYIDKAYYLTDVYCDPNHGRTQILRIENPRDLIKIKTKALPINQKSYDSIISTNSTYLKNLSNKITLLDTSNLVAALFYPYKDHHYLIYSAKHSEDIKFDEIDSTYIGEIVDKRLATIKMILPFPTFTSRIKLDSVTNGAYSYNYSFKHWKGSNKKNENVLFIDSNGSIFIKGDSIVIGYQYFDRRRIHNANTK